MISEPLAPVDPQDPYFIPKLKVKFLVPKGVNVSNGEVVCTVVISTCNIAHHIRARHSREAQGEVCGVGQTSVGDVDRNGGVSAIRNHHRPNCVV